MALINDITGYAYFPADSRFADLAGPDALRAVRTARACQEEFHRLVHPELMPGAEDWRVTILQPIRARILPVPPNLSKNEV